MLQEALPTSTLVVAIDPGKVSNRAWLSSGEAGDVVPPLSLPVLRPGLEQLHRLVLEQTGGTGAVFAIEATGALHQARMRELNQRFPGSVRLFAPSEITAARAQLGSRRFETDDRDCAALTYLARQGRGRPVPDQVQDALAAAVRHRRGLIGEHKVAQQRLHDQLHALCPALAAPDGHGRALQVDSVIGQAVLDCVAAFAGRPPSLRSLRARAHGRIRDRDAEYWVERWRACLAPPTDALARAARLGRSMARWRALGADIAAVDGEIAALLAGSDGQMLTTLPGVAASRAAAFAAFSLPIDGFPCAGYLYSATGLAPGSYQSSTINRRTPISRQGLPEHRDALMNLAGGLSQHCGPGPPAAWPTPCSRPNPSTNSTTVEPGTRASGDGCNSYAARRRNPACRPLALGPPTAHRKACRSTASHQPADQTPPPDRPPRCCPEAGRRSARSADARPQEPRDPKARQPAPTVRQ